MDPHKYGESILLAVSGGVDSMVMATLIRGTVPASHIAVAHCNFHLRGEESDGDAALVRGWCASNGVRCFVKDFDTAGFAAGKAVSIEMAARELRYRWFDDLCSEYGFNGVCVAHNADDNAETLMLNLLRGTGLRGLCAMREISRNPFGTSAVFRPILGFTRAEIMEYAKAHNVVFRTDSTNLENKYRRNKLRNEVFPLLLGINPSLVETLSRDIANFSGAAAIVEDYVKQNGFDGARKVEIPELLADRHWRYLLHSMLSGYGFNTAVISEVCALLESGHIIGGKRFESETHILITTTSSLIVEERKEREEARYLVECLDWNPGDSPKTERGVILVDADALGGMPCIRRWREGDWLQPIGLKGKKKVSDMLTDLKYDIYRKSGALVLEGGEGNSHVLALLGERIDRSVRITPSTKRVYRISML